MTELTPGHVYLVRQLDTTDGVPEPIQVITFVKREGPGYPMNKGHHIGTTSQELLRVLIARTKYVSDQAHQLDDYESIVDNSLVLIKLREIIELLEQRAARRHGRTLKPSEVSIENQLTCQECNHVQCTGECRTKSHPTK